MITVKINRPPTLVRITLGARAQLSRALVSLACVVGLALALPPPLSGSLLHVRRNLGDLEISWKFLEPLARVSDVWRRAEVERASLAAFGTRPAGKDKVRNQLHQQLNFIWTQATQRGICSAVDRDREAVSYSAESGKVLLGLSRDGHIVCQVGCPAALRDECAFMQRIDLP